MQNVVFRPWPSNWQDAPSNDDSDCNPDSSHDDNDDSDGGHDGARPAANLAQNRVDVAIQYKLNAMEAQRAPKQSRDEDEVWIACRKGGSVTLTDKTNLNVTYKVPSVNADCAKERLNRVKVLSQLTTKKCNCSRKCVQNVGHMLNDILSERYLQLTDCIDQKSKRMFLARKLRVMDHAAGPEGRTYRVGTYTVCRRFWIAVMCTSECGLASASRTAKSSANIIVHGNEGRERGVSHVVGGDGGNMQ